MQDLHRYLQDKLRSRSTYVVALIVGTFINVYGHFLVPALRGEVAPLDCFFKEFSLVPALTFSSIIFAYALPLGVGVYSSVATRFQTRPLE